MKIQKPNLSFSKLNFFLYKKNIQPWKRLKTYVNEPNSKEKVARGNEKSSQTTNAYCKSS